jgi:F0F1-type ATP synthase assembly protein I
VARLDFWIAIAAIAATLLAGVLAGVMIGIGLRQIAGNGSPLKGDAPGQG